MPLATTLFPAPLLLEVALGWALLLAVLDPVEAAVFPLGVSLPAPVPEAVELGVATAEEEEEVVDA